MSLTTVTANLKDVYGVIVTDDAYLTFELVNTGKAIPRVPAGSLVLPAGPVYPDGSGNISTTVTDNDTITPANTYYRVSVFVNGEKYRQDYYEITGTTVDLADLTPIASIVPTPPTAAATYQRLDGGNQATGNYLPSTDNTRNLGSAALRWANAYIGMLNGSGSVALALPITGLQDKGSQLFNVKAYGATGDGIANDTTAITSAITAASSVGGVVFFPPGSYAVTSLTLAAKVSLVGSGSLASIIKVSTTGVSVAAQLASPYQSPSIQNIGFDMTGASSNAAAITLTDTAGFIVRDCSFKGTYTSGHIGIKLINLSYFCERNYFVSNQFYGCNPSISFYCQGTNPAVNASWGYNSIFQCHLELLDGTVGILFDGNNISGGIAYYHGLLDLRANLNTITTTGASVIKCVNKASLYNSIVQVMAESPASPTSYMLEHDGSSPGGFNLHQPQFIMSNLTYAKPGSAVEIVGTINPLSSQSNTIFGASVVCTSIFDSGLCRFGRLTGTNIDSPYAAMYDHANNAFTVFRIPLAGSMDTAVPVIYLGADGTVIGHVMRLDTTGAYWSHGTGAPTFSAPVGSLYSRDGDGSAGSALYVNTSGSTTWTPVA